MLVKSVKGAFVDTCGLMFKGMFSGFVTAALKFTAGWFK